MKRTSIIVNDELSRFVRQTETEKRCHANTTNPLYCCQVLLHGTLVLCVKSKHVGAHASALRTREEVWTARPRRTAKNDEDTHHSSELCCCGRRMATANGEGAWQLGHH